MRSFTTYYEAYMQLAWPVIITLFVTIIASIIVMTNSNTIKTLLITTIINFTLLSLATIWYCFIVLDGDGFAQIYQFLMYCICFGVIFVINGFVIMLLRRYKRKINE